MQKARTGRKQPADDGKDATAKPLGSRGGKARARSITAAERTRIARCGARARWKKHRMGAEG